MAWGRLIILIMRRLGASEECLSSTIRRSHTGHRTALATTQDYHETQENCRGEISEFTLGIRFKIKYVTKNRNM